ncbi:MAG TPA: GNAT family N-acetyltransferase [Bacteroidota bacterium]|nr:GNAT family N-acetyltransferase [Bacteroidota bacterium]
MPEIVEALSPDLILIARSLFLEYEASIGVDLCFQGFASEVENLPGKYAPPAGGLFIAIVDGTPMGCVAVRPLDIYQTSELKRLYVRPDGRGKGLGLALTEKAIQRAREAGCRAIRLDTLSTMLDAQRLYRKLGFKEIPAYTFNPLQGTTYMELDLDPLGGTSHDSTK